LPFCKTEEGIVRPVPIELTYRPAVDIAEQVDHPNRSFLGQVALLEFQMLITSSFRLIIIHWLIYNRTISLKNPEAKNENFYGIDRNSGRTGRERVPAD
jgi:hypothetical protein